jgi:hypothetical protein
MLEERSQQVLIRLDAADRPGDRLPQMQGVVGDEVCQVRVLGVVPDLFVRVELGGVGGQPFDADSPTEAFLKPSSSRSMHGPAIHDQDNRSAEPLQQGGDKGFKIVRDDVVVEDVKVETQPFAPWRDCNRRNDRQPVMPISTIQHGSFSTRSPSTPHRRLQHEARFVEADHRPTATSGFFLCEASPLFATARRRRRRAPVRVAPASGNSSRAVAANAKRPIDRNGRRTSSRSIAQFAAASTTRSPNHVCAALAANNSATARTVCRSPGRSAGGGLGDQRLVPSLGVRRLPLRDRTLSHPQFLGDFGLRVPFLQECDCLQATLLKPFGTSMSAHAASCSQILSL